MSELTPDELRELAIVRAHELMDRGDIAPMRQVWTRQDGTEAEAVIPWRQALELEVA